MKQVQFLNIVIKHLLGCLFCLAVRSQCYVTMPNMEYGP